MQSSPATVIVADDNQVLLQGLDRALTANGYTVKLANNGAEVIHLLEQEPTTPDLLLLDVMMPEMSGLDVLRRVHGDGRWLDLPIVLITAANDDALPIAALQDGAVDFLTKPFRLGELIARVDSHVQRYRGLRKAQAEAGAQTRALEVLRDLNSAVTVEEMLHLVTRRAAEMWGVRRCSIVMDEGHDLLRVLASSERNVAGELLVDLRNYPEIREVFATGTPLVVADVADSPLFEHVRSQWTRDGRESPLHSAVIVPLEIAGHPRGALVARAAAGEPALDEEVLDVACHIAEGAVRALGRAQMFESLVEQRKQLYYLASTDELTGCATRRSLLQHLEEQFLLARKCEVALSVVVLDIDGFKGINDQYGHLAGDEVLRTLGEWFRGENALRSRDCAGRYGGDEFVVVLPETGPDGAQRFAERAREFLDSRTFRFDGVEVRVSLSAGIASWPLSGVTSPEDLISRADEALYRAKEGGRNCVRPALIPVVPLPSFS